MGSRLPSGPRTARYTGWDLQSGNIFTEQTHGMLKQYGFSWKGVSPKRGIPRWNFIVWVGEVLRKMVLATHVLTTRAEVSFKIILIIILIVIVVNYDNNHNHNNLI